MIEYQIWFMKKCMKDRKLQGIDKEIKVEPCLAQMQMQEIAKLIYINK